MKCLHFMADKYSSHGGYTVINVASAMVGLLIANDAPDHQAATKPGYHGNALMPLARGRRFRHPSELRQVI
jgi:hypothetical protein